MHESWPVSLRAPAYVLVLLVTGLLAVWGSFLVPLRFGGLVVPVCWGLAVGGNLAVGWAGARLLDSPLGAALPGLLWTGVVFALASRRAEGDVVVPGTRVGTAFLVLGALASAVAYALALRAAKVGSTR